MNASRESHAKQKATAKERKAAKPNADSIARAKKLWEKLRIKSHVPLGERKELVAELYDIITGHVKEFVFKHDTVRVIETALKYAEPSQKKMIAAELKGEYKPLSQSKYGKFLVGKLLSYGDKETRDMVVPEFYGSVKHLIKHPEASWILDDVYRGAATPLQKAKLLREWYGAEYAIQNNTDSQDSTADLQVILAETPEKRKPMMHSLHELINLLIQKKTTAFTMLHDAMLQYYLNIQPASEEGTNFLELLKGDEENDLLKNLAFTKSGARLVCLALAHSTAKDRKLILRAYKNTISMMSYDTHAHQILLTAYDVIDDTVLTSKLIFPELLSQSADTATQQSNLLSQITNYIARIPLLYLSANNPKAYLPAADLDLLAEIHSIRTTTSKKDPLVRRQELLAQLIPPLITLIANCTEDLVSSSYGCQFITETILSAPSSCSAKRQEALQALATLVRRSESVDEVNDGGKVKTLLAQPFASRMLKNLVQGGRFDSNTKKVVLMEPKLGFAELTYEAVGDKMLQWAAGEHSFVVVALLETEDFEGREKLKKLLEKERRTLEKAAESGGGKDGTAKKSKKGGGTRKATEKEKGNAGARLLLDRLD